MADRDDFMDYFGLNLMTIVRLQGFLVLRVVPKPKNFRDPFPRSLLIMSQASICPHSPGGPEIPADTARTSGDALPFVFWSSGSLNPKP